MGGQFSGQVRWKMSLCLLHPCPAPPVSLKGIPPPREGAAPPPSPPPPAWSVIKMIRFSASLRLALAWGFSWAVAARHVGTRAAFG